MLGGGLSWFWLLSVSRTDAWFNWVGYHYSDQFWGERKGQRPLGGSLSTFFGWKILWYASLWCLEGFRVGFCSFETTFFWSPFIVYMYVWRFEIFGGGLLGGSMVVSELDLKLREYSDLALFFLNAPISCPNTMQKSFLRQIILNKSEKRLEVRFPLSIFVKILDFPRLGQTPPRPSGMDFFGWKTVWLLLFWCLGVLWVDSGFSVCREQLLGLPG